MKGHGRMDDVIGIGVPYFDVLCLSDALPAEDTKAKAERIVFQGGGPCATAMVTVARLGHKAAFWGVVGDDAAGRHMLEEFEKYGVSTDETRVAAGAASGVCIVLVAENTRSRTCLYTKSDIFREPETLNYERLEQARLLHLDGNWLEVAISAAKFAKSKGVPVSLDAGSVYAGIEALLPLVDILITSESFATEITNREGVCEAAVELRRRYDPPVLVITRGEKGGVICPPGSQRCIPYPVFSVEAVDTNGAGDVFHGAFIAAYLEGADVKRACVFASAASALKCTGFGARASIPTHEAVENFLKTNTESAATAW